jgi:phospholipid transport system substrate-binding protein
MKRFSSYLTIAAAFLLGVATTPLHAESLPSGHPSAMAEMQTTLDGIIKVVEAAPGDDNKDKRRDQLRLLINPKFDFGEMAKRSLGTYWKEITPAEQEEFVRVFSDLLARTYLSRIETVKPGMVKVDAEDVDFPKALVKTTVTNKGDQFPIDYKLLSRDGKWQVYDVVIENIGLVANYRNEFAGIIRKEKFAGLLDRLRKKA